MLIRDLMNFGARPALTEAQSFAAGRHRLIINNIANMQTPNYQQQDVSVPGFQKALREAVDRRRESAQGSDVGVFEMPETKELVKGPRGFATLNPRTDGQGILYHDRNNRDMERLMQNLAENGLQYRFATDVLRQQGELLRTAIAQRV